MPERFKIIIINAVWTFFQIQFLVFLFLISNTTSENKALDGSEGNTGLLSSPNKNPDSIKNSIAKPINEITLLSSSEDVSSLNSFELNVQDQCNQLWTYRNKLVHEVSNVVKLHKQFVTFLNKNDPKKSTIHLEEIFKKSLDLSINDQRREEINQKFREYFELAIDYQFISSDKDESKIKILISSRSFLKSTLKDFFFLKNEYLKYSSNFDMCIKKKKKVIKYGSDSLNMLINLSKLLNIPENTLNDENNEYLAKISIITNNLDSNFSFIKTLRKLQEICDKDIIQDNQPDKKSQIKWLKKNLNKINKTIDSFESIFKINSKKVNNLLNCINHFQNSNSINENTLGMINTIGNQIVNHSINRRNILSVISSRYTITTLNTYILNNRLFSLWLFIQKRLTAVQVAIKIIKESKELTNRIKSIVSMDDSIDFLTKCSETLRKTASDWNIFFSNKNSAIIKKLHKETLEQLNHYKFEDDPNKLAMYMEWIWLNNNIQSIIDQGYDMFESMIKDNLQDPLKSCAKKLSSLYKNLKTEFSAKENFSEKIRKKVNKEYRSTLNDVSGHLLKQINSLSSLKHSFLWPHNNATLVSAISMYNRTSEFVNSINLSQDQNSFEKSSYSYELLKQQQIITNGFSTLYENIKTRFNWDLNLFQAEFGYVKNINLGLETEETIDFSKLKVFQEPSDQFGEWFENTLEFLNLNDYNLSKIKNILGPAIQFRLQFIQQWSDIITKIINKVGNPTALSISKISEEAYTYYLKYQVSKSKEFSNYFESDLSILKYVDAVDYSLSDLNRESFVSKFETTNSPNLDGSYHGDDEFPSVSSIKSYLSDLKNRVDNYCNTEQKRKKNEDYSSIIKKICDEFPIIFSTIHQNLKGVDSKLQKVYSDLDSQKEDIKKLDAIIQDCVSLDNKVGRVKCWIPNQSIELPLRRALQIRKVMNNWLRETIKTKILLFSNFIEDCLKLNFKGSLIFQSNEPNKTEKTQIERIKSFRLLLKLINDLMPNIVDELNTLETIYSKFYQNKIKEITSASKLLVFNYVKLNSMKITLIHNYGKANLFQRIFRFPKLLLSKDEVYNIESSTFAFDTPVNNNATYAADLTDYIKNNQVSSNNHTILLGKYLKALSTLKNRIEDIPQLKSDNSSLLNENLKSEIEFEKYKSIEEKSLLILGESDKYLKLANIEHFRFYTVRNITGNVTDVISNLSEEIKSKEEELEKREEDIANTNCYRRWKWKKRVKKRKMKKIKDEKIDKMIKINKSNANLNILKLKKKEANGKLKLFLTKIINIENFDTSYRPVQEFENISYDDSDLESFQFDDLYKFDERPGRFNPKNQEEGEIDYDVDTGGRTEYGKKPNSLISKISTAVDMAVTINNSIRQYKEVKNALEQSGVEFGQENSGVNLLAGFDVLNALTGGPTDDLSAILGSINEQDKVFNEADILGELQTGEMPNGLEKEVNSRPLEGLDISYDDFKRKVEFELKNSDLNFDFDD
ncbi:rhoptry [Cryptosporidium sp. chipmunk genotype I]|uniref:rhoptry n=1 Tax=Cryptosporidium sp. chipmunk genotype I TaxID=1280935 RepID=UPI00351A4FF0|nr:rhoptry [Cryptosporidium sp. chipmunk genotype I]